MQVARQKINVINLVEEKINVINLVEEQWFKVG